MLRYLLQRLWHLVITMLVVSALVFTLMNLVGNPVRLLLPEDADLADIARLTRQLGLDQPVYVRYGTYMAGLLQGDFGRSFKYGEPALDVVLERTPITLALSGASLVFGVVLSIPLGVLAALRRNTWVDLLATGTAVAGRSMPNFWLGIMLILLFSQVLWLRGTVPLSGTGTWKHLILPTVTLGAGLMAILTRLTRSSLLEVIRQDFITTARSKGLAERVVIFRHALRNALIPVITVLGLQMATLIEGAVVTEQVFAIPGMGRLTVNSLQVVDFSVVQAAVILSALMIVGSNFVVDIVYTLIDPRIRYD